MTLYEKHTVLIVCSSLEDARRIKLAMKANGSLNTAATCTSFEDLSRHLQRTLVEYSLTFVSSSFDEIEAKAIQQALAHEEKVENAPTILLVDKESKQGDVILQLLIGYDGVLMSPFSAEELALVIDSAYVSREVGNDTREDRIMQSLARSIHECQSQTAMQLRKGMGSKVSRHIMKELTQSVNELSSKFLPKFYLSLLKEYANRKPKAAPEGRTYSTALQTNDISLKSSAHIFEGISRKQTGT